MNLPRDRKEQALGEYLLHDYGPDGFRDCISDELVREIGKLIQCGDLASVGSLLVRTLLADDSMAKSMLLAAEHDEQDRQRELFEHLLSRPSRLATLNRQFDGETGIALSGPL